MDKKQHRKRKNLSVLVEMGFLSNYSESQKLLNDDYQEILAQRMAEGIFNKIKGDENL